MRYLLAVAALLAATHAQAAVERRISLDFVGFTGDGEHFVVKKFDYNVGWSFSVRALVDGAQVKSYAFEDGEEDRTLRRVRRGYGGDLQEGTGPKSPDGEYVALGTQEGRFMDILVMKKPQIGRFQAVPLPSDDRRRPLAEGMMKKAVWSPDGKWLVVIIEETTTGDARYAVDKAYSWKFRPYKVQWFREGSE